MNRDIRSSEDKFSNYRIAGPTSSFSISGFIPETGTDGQLLTIINTSNAPMTIVHNNFSRSANRIFCPGGKNLQIREQYAAITFQYNKTIEKWIVVSKSTSNETATINSVSFEGEVEIDYADYKQFKNVPGMEVKFIAQGTTAMVIFTTSGETRTPGVGDSELFLRILDQNNTTFGGVALSTRNNYNFESLSFSKLMTGLIPGNEYTLHVQGKTTRSGSLGNPRYVVKPLGAPAERETDHMTLTIIQ